MLTLLGAKAIQIKTAINGKTNVKTVPGGSMLNNSKLNESPSKHLRNDSKDNSIYEQGLGENYDKSHWQMPKDDAFVIEDVEKMQRRMEEFDRHDGIIRQDSDLSAL